MHDVPDLGATGQRLTGLGHPPEDDGSVHGQSHAPRQVVDRERQTHGWARTVETRTALASV
ncbi:hypothetical protein SMALB_0320 [Streptomyces malaysiensis]|uniref:Uncharacterized protein n=1 Tax=Streptomyces malaysiensis TaxID=92644 RepID=A0A7X5WYY1_STRMQ|nr:hypothetical protein [Streptomyces malaysiensis]